jgi:uncharacterized protein YciI
VSLADRKKPVPRLFAVMRSRGEAWDPVVPMEEQSGWRAHADFMDRLYAEGFVLLVGPLEGSSDFLLVARAESEIEVRERLAADPWGEDRLILKRVAPWTLRLGSLD